MAGCNWYTYRAHVFRMRTLSACLPQPVVTNILQGTVIFSRIHFTHTRGSSTTRNFAHCVLPKIVTSHPAISHVTPHLSIIPTELHWRNPHSSQFVALLLVVHVEVPQGGFLFSSSACELAGKFPEFRLDDLTLWPTEWCDVRRTLLLESVAFFFAGLRAVF